MRIPKLTLPANNTFTYLDSRVTASDSFLNARDEQVARRNHNVLYARRIRRTLLTQVCGTTDAKESDSFFAIDMSGGSPTWIYRIPIAITQGTQSIRVKLRAHLTDVNVASAMTKQASLFFVLAPWGRSRRWNSTDAVSVEATYPASPIPANATTYGITLGASHMGSAPMWHNKRLGELMIGLVGRMDTTRTVAASVAITDAGEDWVQLASGTYPYGNVICIGTNYRVVLCKVGNRHFVDAPWTNIITPGTSTADVRESIGVHIWSISAYENVMTNFWTSTGVV